jgi:hypothetical protein
MNQCGQGHLPNPEDVPCAGRRGLARVAILRSACGPTVMDAGLAIPA